MAKRSKKRVVARTLDNPILNANKIALSELVSVVNPLVDSDITTTGDDYAIDTTEFQSTSDIGTPQEPVTKQSQVSVFRPVENNIENNIDDHEPNQSFITDAVASYFNLTKDALRILSRDDEYCDDSVGAINDALFEVTTGRPTVIAALPEITDGTITDNILMTYDDISNKQLKSVVGLPNTTHTYLYNHETDPVISDSSVPVINPSLDMFVSLLAGEQNKAFNTHETVNTFYFKAGSRTSNIVCVNKFNASYFNMRGILSVKPKLAFVDSLKTVTLYIEVSTATTIAEAYAADDSSWVIAESKVVPVNAYGVFLTMSAYLCKNAIVRLRTNLDSTMGSLNVFQLRDAGGFVNHFSNTFTAFSGIIGDIPMQITITTTGLIDDDLRITIGDVEVSNLKRNGWMVRSITITKTTAEAMGATFAYNQTVHVDVFDGWASNYRITPWIATILWADGTETVKTGGITAAGTTVGHTMPSPIGNYYNEPATFETYYDDCSFTLTK